MRSLIWWSLAACGGSGSASDSGVAKTTTTPSTTPDTETTTSTTDTGPIETTGPAPCDPVKGLSVTSAKVSQPWSEHEAEIVVELTQAASVAVACALDGDPEEVHLVEASEEAEQHALRLAGLLQSSTYECVAAPVCPGSSDEPRTFTLETGAESNDRLPELLLNVKEATAGSEYVVANHQVNPNPPEGWQGQRRLVFDRDARFRWHATPNAGGNVGVNVVSFQPASQHFTIGGAWPATPNGRPQQLALYGSGTVYDSLPDLPDDHGRKYHHEARELPDGRLLALQEIPITKRPEDGGGTFDGFRVMLVNPATGDVEFTYSSQRAYDERHLRGGGGDVYHANWADVVNDVLYVSLCYAGSVIAIDVPSGDWRWRMGPQGDFDLVDRAGNPLPDNGGGNDSQSQWPQCQHGLQVRGNRILVYDNGNNGRNYSRAVEYQVDESAMTATLRWSWTEDDWWERSLGGVDYTAGGNVLIAAGHLESFTPSPGDLSTFIEIDPTTGDKLWEVQYGRPQDSAYRAEAIAPCDLFANAKYCPVTAARLQTLEPVLGVISTR